MRHIDNQDVMLNLFQHLKSPKNMLCESKTLK